MPTRALCAIATFVLASLAIGAAPARAETSGLHFPADLDTHHVVSGLSIRF